MHISKKLHSKVLKFCTQAGLNETFMCAKFQIKIWKYYCIDKLPPTEKSSLKIQYFGPNFNPNMSISILLIYRPYINSMDVLYLVQVT
jgi:hypothetical protein